MNYNPWPLGKLKPEHQRQEPHRIKGLGYKWNDPREIVDMFEKKVSEYFGAKYGVAVDCCANAIFLCLQYLKSKNGLPYRIYIPKHTYISVPMQVLHCGVKVTFIPEKWEGCYRLVPSRIIDAAVIWERNAYVPESLMCLSFQIKKAIPIGRGGMILTDDKDEYEWLKLASHDGRNLDTPYDSEGHIKMLGWNMYMSPEDAARGLLLMNDIGDKGKYMGWKNYPDVSQMLKGII